MDIAPRYAIGQGAHVLNLKFKEWSQMSLHRFVTPIVAGAASVALVAAALFTTTPQPSEQGARIALAQEDQTDYSEDAPATDQQEEAEKTAEEQAAEEQAAAERAAAEQAAAEQAAAEQAKADAIAEWGSRIDAYLSGSPLAGYGQLFAQTAIENGIDPRLAPAIATVESGKGSVCFRPHNAWGWGGYGWSDWETAIPEYMSGLAAGYSDCMAEGDYGLTTTTTMASVYCGSTDWYYAVVGEMSAI